MVAGSPVLEEQFSCFFFAVNVQGHPLLQEPLMSTALSRAPLTFARAVAWISRLSAGPCLQQNVLLTSVFHATCMAQRLRSVIASLTIAKLEPVPSMELFFLRVRVTLFLGTLFSFRRSGSSYLSRTNGALPRNSSPLTKSSNRSSSIQKVLQGFFQKIPSVVIRAGCRMSKGPGGGLLIACFIRILYFQCKQPYYCQSKEVLGRHCDRQRCYASPLI